MSDHPTDVIPLHGSTRDSAEFHLRKANEERAAIGMPPQERLELADDATVNHLREMARSNVRFFPRRKGVN